jgi:hypothetical protein
MHNKPMIQLVQTQGLELRPLMTPRLRRAGAPREGAPRESTESAAAAEAAPWRERRATSGARRRSER